MKLNPESIARASSRHPWRTIGLWLVLIVAMGAVSSQLLGDVLTQDFEFTNRPESVRAQEVIDEEFANGSEVESTEFVIVQSESLTVDDPGFREVVTGLQGKIAALDGAILAAPPVTYYDLAQESPEQAAGLVSQDQRTTLITVPLTNTEISTIEELRAIAERGQTDGSPSRSPARGCSSRTSRRSPRRTCNGANRSASGSP